MTPADAALGAAGMSALAALLVAVINVWASRALRRADIAAASERQAAALERADERRRQERSEAWARFEGSMIAKFDEQCRRHDRTDERLSSLEEKVSSLPCWNCSPPHNNHPLEVITGAR